MAYRVPIVYRGARTASWVKRGVVQARAFYRRKEKDLSGLTVGDTQEAAIRNIKPFAVIQISVEAIEAIRLENDDPPVRLQVVLKDDPADQGNIDTTLPFQDDSDLDQVGLAIRIAQALADIAAPANPIQ
jgi:hypothetical protein